MGIDGLYQFYTNIPLKDRITWHNKNNHYIPYMFAFFGTSRDLKIMELENGL